MIDEREILAAKLKEFRKSEALNQFEFAEDCGISREVLSLIERERENVTIDTVQLIATRIGVTVSELLSCTNSITYVVIPSFVEIEGEIVKTYGIGTIRNNILIDYVADISTNFNKVKALALRWNKLNLSPIHLRDAVEDALCE